MKAKRSLPGLSLVGPRRMGQALARRLVKNGTCRLETVVGRNPARCRKAVAFIGAGRPSLILTDAFASEVILVAVPDDVLPSLGAGIRLPRIKGKAVLHTSGASGTDVLGRWKKLGAHVGMLHPMTSAATPERGFRNLRRCAFAVSGGTSALRASRRLLAPLGSPVIAVAPKDCAAHHLACVLVSNFPVLLWKHAFSLSELAGKSGVKRHRQALLALAEASLSNVRTLGPERALTGPAARGDAATIRRHLSVLRRRRPHLLELYKILTLEAVLAAVEEKRLSREAVRRLVDVLA